MKTRNIGLLLIIAVFISISMVSCKKKDASSKNKDLNIYVDIKDKNSLNIIKFLTEEYKKDNPQAKIKINDVLGAGGNIAEDISKGSEADLVFTSRNNMIELSQKGLISDLGQQFERNKITDKYYKIMPSYGRIGDKYYGIGILPYAVEIIYNGDALNKLGITAPTSIKDMPSVAKKFVASGMKIPVILPEDIDVNIALSSMVAANSVKLPNIDTAFDNSNSYKNIKEMQQVFDNMNNMIKTTGLNKSLFELGNESTIASLASGTVPMVITSSYYYNNLKDAKVNIVEDYTVSPNQIPSVPVIVNTILCMPTNGKNAEDAGKFIKFVVSEDTQDKLVKKGYITASKKSNEKLSGIGASIDKHLATANDNSIIYVYNLPKKFQEAISSRIDAIFNSKYTGHEWTDIVNEIYNK